MQYASYIVCKEHLNEVSDFLARFFNRLEGRYTHNEWITFSVPKTDFSVNLMKGDDQDITQNMTFEIYFESLEELEEFAEKNNVQTNHFEATKSLTSYTYYFCEIPGPRNICKIEASFTEDLF